MLRAYKYRIYPTDEQKALLAKTFGCCRFVYNWALNLKITAYKERKETLGNVYLTNLMKSELKAEHEWLSEVNSQSLQSALRNLDTAYNNFFRNTKAIGFPRFKSRKNKQSFITHALTHDSQVRTLCMEDLNVKGMQRNHHLTQAVGDASFGMFLTMLEYKCRWYGVNLVKIDRFAPSSKTCGQCGYVYKGLKLSERSWTCPECGTHHDRDFNAACNIKEFGLKALPSERGDVKPVDCPTVDDRPRVLKSRGRKKQEKRGGIGISEAAKSLV